MLNNSLLYSCSSTGFRGEDNNVKELPLTIDEGCCLMTSAHMDKVEHTLRCTAKCGHKNLCFGLGLWN